MRKWIALLVLWLALSAPIWLQRSAAADPLPPTPAPLPPAFPTPPDNYIPSPDIVAADAVRAPLAPATAPTPIIYGVNFVSSAEYSAARRYTDLRTIGAQWNRLPIYWQAIERTADQFTWSAHDPVIAADTENGLLINAILLGMPGFYYSGSRAVPNTLWQPVFSDGSDIPGPGKAINPNNKWARFVFNTVNRYKPGGVLAQQRGWPAGAGVRHWEIWNEPDLPWFWEGSKQEYARLLKVGYLAANLADPGTRVIFGGLANNYDQFDYYRDVLAILQADSWAIPTGYFHDILATHSYFFAWQSWHHVYRQRNTMLAFGLDKPIWLNEAGVPAWNDYPGPVWDSRSQYRATLSEQADYVIQSAFYTLFAGADAVFHFQLYDGCGNQPQNTDFPPHTGNLCDANGNLIWDSSRPCAGDAFGLYRNYQDAACFRQHPQPGSPRPAVRAYQLVTQYLQDVMPLARYKVCTLDRQSWIGYYRPNTNQRVMALWACLGQQELAVVPALESGAMLITPDGAVQYIAPFVDGHYYLTLPAATNTQPLLDPRQYPIGGRPYILIERDLQPPTVTLQAQGGSGNVAVSWSGDDRTGSGVVGYDLAVSVDGGSYTPWLTNVAQTSATYTGAFNTVLGVRVVARDRGNNVSQPVVKQVFAGPPPEPPVVAKSASRATAAPWEIVAYQVTVRNPGPTTNPAVRLTNALPHQLTFRNGTLTASTGSVAWNNGVVSWSGSLTAGQTAQITYQALAGWVGAPTAVVNSSNVTDDFGRNVTASATLQITYSGPPNLPHRRLLPIIMR